ncbi:MAG: hypothetical protein KY446_11090 [Proteobacteria bacterium]|nr:hypothetical protein [Pseudomonadota bacterium]
MTKTISRLKYGFFALFLLGSAASTYHAIYVVKPRQDCERKGAWWDPEERICATPIDISLFTGRPRTPAAASAPSRPAQP